MRPLNYIIKEIKSGFKVYKFSERENRIILITRKHTKKD